jgi:hypothetical protein
MRKARFSIIFFKIIKYARINGFLYRLSALEKSILHSALSIHPVVIFAFSAQ